jgi:acetoin utilization deacetylase AcuC-like enzyme
MAITLFSHSSCYLHLAGDDHPEQPARLSAINDQLIRSGLEFIVQQRDATPASAEDLYHVHDKLYVDEIFNKTPEDGHIWLDPGFCIFNNIAVAAAYALEHYQLSRVAIVDFDVHHGNGTEDIFAADGRVLFCSSFQYPLYPNTGEHPSASNIENLPLPALCKPAIWREQILQHWLPRINEFKPQLILVSAGFDGHREDDMAQFLLTEADYQWIAQQLKQLADQYCQGRIVAALEGGYALSALGRSVVAFLKGLM